MIDSFTDMAEQNLCDGKARKVKVVDFAAYSKVLFRRYIVRLAIIFVIIFIILLYVFRNIIALILPLLFSSIGIAIILMVILVCILLIYEAGKKSWAKKIFVLDQVSPGFMGIPVVFGKPDDNYLVIGDIFTRKHVVEFIKISTRPVDLDLEFKNVRAKNNATVDFELSITYQVPHPCIFYFWTKGGEMVEGESTQISKTLLDALSNAGGNTAGRINDELITTLSDAAREEMLLTFLKYLKTKGENITKPPELPIHIGKFGINLTFFSLKKADLDPELQKARREIEKENLQREAQKKDVKTKGELTNSFIESIKEKGGKIDPVLARIFIEKIYDNTNPGLGDNFGDQALKLGLAQVVSDINLSEAIKSLMDIINGSKNK